jgi:hypothetical protein
LFGYVVVGIGVGILGPPLVAVGMAAVAPHQSGTAAGAVNTARQLGLALGVAVLGTVLRGTAGGGNRIPLARFVTGLDAAVAVACAVGIALGLVTFTLFSRRTRTTIPEPAVEQVPVV